MLLCISSEFKYIFNKLVISDLIRMGYTYAMFLFVALILVKFQPLEYDHVLVMTILYVILTLIHSLKLVGPIHFQAIK